MSSYFDYYCSNLENDTAYKTKYIKGVCYTMCPQDEIKLRERENMVHVLEVWGSERKLVKSYSRSAADSNMAIPKILRPFAVLRDTVKYLLLEVAKRIDVPSSVVYDYVTDRLRAVRQDMTIQRLPPHECVRLLDPMVRFHVYYGYRLCNLPLKDYDLVLNKKYLLECLKWCLSCWDTIYKGEDIDNDKVEELSEFLTDLNIRKGNRDLPCDRILMETLYILCNLNYVHPLIRYTSLPKDLKIDRLTNYHPQVENLTSRTYSFAPPAGLESQSRPSVIQSLNTSSTVNFSRNPTLESANKVGIANWKQNYIQVGKALDTSCPLSYCALYAHLPELQRLALLLICHAYNNKRFTVPCDKVRQWLRLFSNYEVRKVCAYYGLELVGDNVRFTKGDFNSELPVHQLEPRKFNETLDLSIDNIFLYRTNKK